MFILGTNQCKIVVFNVFKNVPGNNLENPLLHPAPLLQQTSFHSVHYLCSQINTITNDPSKVTCRNKEEITIWHFKLDCFINNFSFGTRFTNELKKGTSIVLLEWGKKKPYQGTLDWLRRLLQQVSLKHMIVWYNCLTCLVFSHMNQPEIFFL